MDTASHTVEQGPPLAAFVTGHFRIVVAELWSNGDPRAPEPAR